MYIYVLHQTSPIKGISATSIHLWSICNLIVAIHLCLYVYILRQTLPWMELELGRCSFTMGQAYASSTLLMSYLVIAHRACM